MNLEPIIGLEIHVQLKTKSKMFCGCENGGEGQTPNTTICPVCTGQPGTLPVANKQAIEWTALTGLALNCRVAELSKFDRKNYFYPDLPKGYQISQYDLPIAENGWLEIKSSSNSPQPPLTLRGGERKIGITRIHLEEDTGKLLHSEDGQYTFVDFNRAGTPLMELVTEPVLRSPAEAKEFCQEFQMILHYLGVSDADMEKGQMRCEANVSLQERDKWQYQAGKIKPKGKYQLNPKVEVKNLNSFKAVERALEYEIKRMTKLLKNEEKWEQATRGWDENKGETFTQRTKEEAQDYRYFPEPDIPPLRFDKKWVTKLKNSLPELPQAKRKRFIQEYEMPATDAKIITDDLNLASYVEKVISELRAWLIALEEVEGSEKEIWDKYKKKLVKLVSSWLNNKLFALLKSTSTDIKQCKITPENFAELITLIYQNKINSANAQLILGEMFKTGIDPSQVMEEKDLGQISNSTAIESQIEEILKENPDAVAEYKKGKETVIQFLIGQVMRKTKGKADPRAVEDLLKKKLKRKL